MPINTSFLDQHLSSAMVLYCEKSSLTPQRIKDKVIISHQLKLLAKILSSPSDLLALKKVLADNWHTYKATPCGYTAQPESDVTLLLCDIVNTLGQITGEKPIHILMPGVSTESIVDGVASLDEMDIKTVLKAHILSDSGKYLYPVAALASLACESDLASQKIPNPYYDYNQVTEKEENEGYIPVAALERMLNHSLDTQAILDAKTLYESLIKPTNLLGQLQLLIKTLLMNSVSGIGIEEQAGSRAYAGIISFNDYYQTLNNEQKSLIPKDLKDEIEFLLKLSSSKEQNDEATETLQTCINIRQENLASLTKSYEHILINIGVDEQTQSELIKKAREDFVLSQNQIPAKCVQGSYDGTDKLALSKKLVDALKVPVEIRSRADLRDFLSLTASDIESLLENNEALQHQVAIMLENLDNLVLFSTQTPIEQMKVVLHFVANKLPKLTCSELSLWLEVLDLKRFEVIFNVYKNSVIENSANFKELLEHLSVEKRDMIFSEFENVLPNLMQTPADIHKILEYLSDAQCTKMYETFKHKISSMIQKALDFSALLEHLSLEQQNAVYQEMKHRIPDLVENADNLAMVIAFLSKLQCKEVLAAVKARLHEVITSAVDVNVALCCLNVENRAVLFKAIKDRLPKLIKTAKDVGRAFEFLNVAQSIVLFEKIKPKLLTLSESPKNIHRMLQRLSVEQSRMVLQLLPPKWTQSASNIGLLLKKLTPTHRFIFLEMIKEKLTCLIQSANNVREICEHLSDEQSGYVLSAIIDKVPSLIQTVDDFILVSDYFDDIDEVDHDKIESLDKAIKKILPSLINTCEDLGKLLEIAGSDAQHQFEQFFEMAKDKLSDLLKYPRDVGKLLKFVEVKQRLALLEAIISKLPNIFKTEHDEGAAHVLLLLDLEQPGVLATTIPRFIQNAKSFYEIFEHLSNERRKVLFDAMEDRLPSLIKNAKDAGYVLARLDSEQSAIVFEAIKEKIPNLIQSAKDLYMLRFLKNKQYLDITFEMIKHKFPDLIQRARDLDSIRFFKNKHIDVIFEMIKHKLPSLIHQASDIGIVLENLTIKQSEFVLHVLKTKLSSLIKNDNDVHNALESLNDKSCHVVLEAIKDQLPRVFKTVKHVNTNFFDGGEKRAMIIAALEKAQASDAANPPTFLPHKRLIEGNEQPAKRQKRVGRREMEFVRHNVALEQPRERKRQENEAKRQRMSHS